MEKPVLIERGYKEGLGRYFLKKAVDFAIEKSFGKSYEYIKEGLDILTCDCNRGGWRTKFIDSDKSIFSELIINYPEIIEYYFVKAYLLSFEENKTDLYIALDAIEKYISKRKDEYGFYIKGKIFLSLGEYSDAFEQFKKASEFKESARILYRIGRIKEQFLNKYGLENLYKSFDINPSSSCCTRTLKKFLNEKKAFIHVDDKEKNKLIIAFGKLKDSKVFDALYEKYLNHEYVDYDLPWPMEKTLPEIIRFVDFVRENSGAFSEKVNNPKHISTPKNDDEPESFGNYAGSWAQEVEGLSDDYIDNVLGGDPDAYWNID